MIKRHSWGKEQKAKHTTYQRCVNCNLYRAKALGIWMYTKDNPNDVELWNNVLNKGCNEVD